MSTSSLDTSSQFNDTASSLSLHFTTDDTRSIASHYDMLVRDLSSMHLGDVREKRFGRRDDLAYETMRGNHSKRRAKRRKAPDENTHQGTWQDTEDHYAASTTDIMSEYSLTSPGRDRDSFDVSARHLSGVKSRMLSPQLSQNTSQVRGSRDRKRRRRVDGDTMQNAGNTQGGTAKKSTLQQQHDTFRSTLPSMHITKNCNIRFQTQVGRREFFEHQRALKSISNDLDYDWQRSKDYLHYHIASADINRSESRRTQLANENEWANVGLGDRGDAAVDKIRANARVFSTDFSKLTGREPSIVSSNTKLLEEQMRTLGPGYYDANDRLLREKEAGVPEFEKTCGREDAPIVYPSDAHHLDSGQYHAERGLRILSTTRGKLPDIKFGTERRSKLVLQTGLPVSHDLVYDAKKPEPHVPTFQLSKVQPHRDTEPVEQFMHTATQIVNNLNSNITKVRRLKKKAPYVKRLQRKVDWMEQMYFDMGVKSAPLRLVEG